MKCPVFLLFACLAAPLGAQISAPPPDALLDAGHCLATAQQDWLHIKAEKPFEVELGYVEDTHGPAGQTLLYVIDYSTPLHSEGTVFAFLVRGKESHRILMHGKESHPTLSLQYKAAFRQSTDGSQQIELINPSFGGIWTQEQIVSAIHQVGFHTYTIPVATLVNLPDPAPCESDAGVE